MHEVALTRPGDLEQFRDAARRLIGAGVPPEQVLWHQGEQRALFGAPLPGGAAAPAVPAAFVKLADDVICHRDPERMALLYRALWRLVHGERHLLEVASDPLVHRLMRMAQAVRRDVHKMTAFVRFRRAGTDEGERFVAWFEPEHHILRRAAPFFVGRFAALRWSILTPAESLHWDGRALTFAGGVPREQAPGGDALEDWWRAYYRATFNPARANPDVMRAEMPKKYWRNLPETELIPGLLAAAAARTRTMLETAPSGPRKRIRRQEPATIPDGVPGTLAQLGVQARGCERCPLFRPATQVVLGEGPADATVVLVGEQPGDEEDLTGRPFVGPAGRLLDRALEDAGIARDRLYLTNAVKHFKFEVRGKRRMHQRPNTSEIEHCRWWLERELALLRPELTVALGASAARALLDRDVGVLRERGCVELPGGRAGFITIHPSFLLRLPDARAREREYARFVQDLARIVALVPAVGRGIPARHAS